MSEGTVNVRQCDSVIGGFRTPGYEQTMYAMRFGDGDSLVECRFQGVNAKGKPEVEIFYVAGDGKIDISDQKLAATGSGNKKKKTCTSPADQREEFLNGVNVLAPYISSLRWRSECRGDNWWIRFGPLPTEVMTLPCTPMSLIKILRQIECEEAFRRRIGAPRPIECEEVNQNENEHYDIFTDDANVTVVAKPGYVKINVTQD